VRRPIMRDLAPIYGAIVDLLHRMWACMLTCCELGTKTNRLPVPPRTPSPKIRVPLLGMVGIMRGEQLRRYLQKTVAKRIVLTLDDDRRAILRAKESGEEAIALRLHGSFLDAPARVLRALVRYVRRPEPHLRRRVQRLYRSVGLDRLGGETGRRVLLRHRGRHFDLKEIFDDLNRRFFDGSVKAFVTWGRRTRASRRNRSIHFGSYNWERRLIRVNPALDRGFVPRYFLESIIFHEMLHAHLGVSAGRDGRRNAHSSLFRHLERSWPGYERARRWEKAHLHRFLRAARPGQRRRRAAVSSSSSASV